MCWQEQLFRRPSNSFARVDESEHQEGRFRERYLLVELLIGLHEGRQQRESSHNVYVQSQDTPMPMQRVLSLATTRQPPPAIFGGG